MFLEYCRSRRRGDQSANHGRFVGRDGNDIDELDAAFEKAKTVKDCPSVLIANTVKGKGSSVIENKANWHHRVPSEDEYQTIMKDLKTAEEVLLNDGQ